MSLPDSVEQLLAAVAARDATAVGNCFTEDGSYHFAMPGDPVRGRDIIIAAFTKILGECARVQWDIVNYGVTPAAAGSAAAKLVWTERIDRFWFTANPGAEVGIECMGVVELAPDGRIAAIRDYVDMTVWRSRKAAVE